MSLPEYKGADVKLAPALGLCVLSHKHELPSDNWQDLPLDQFLRVEMGVLGLLEAS